MEAKKLEYFKELLLVKKKELEDELGKLEEKFKVSQQDSSSDLSSHPTHMADISGDAEDREYRSCLITSMVEELAQVNRAIEKIYSDSYGVCEKCGSSISLKRLDAIPYAELCIKCGKNS